MSKTVLITGAGKGIGYETTRNLSAAGHKIIALSRHTGSLKALGHSNIIPFAFDLLQHENYDEIHAFLKKEVGELDIIINNAGLLIKKDYHQLTHQDISAVFCTNVFAPLLLLQQLKPLLRKGSHVVNIGSMGGITNTVKFPGMSAYSSSKGALAVLTECLATELKESDITINCLALGAANTEMVQQAFPGYSAPVSANEMASYIAWFALNGPNWFNGQVIPVAMSTP